MTVIIPRWEWRMFGQHFGAAEAAFDAMTSTGEADSDETYLLVTGTGAPSDVVKVRFDLMDIKVLREVSAAGLERWEPILKVGFPMPAADVQRVSEALHLPSPILTRADYTLQQFLDEVTGPSGMVRPVEVHKHRVRYMVGGCSAERSDVVADGRTIRTIAIESEDAAAVVGAVRSVGLDGYINTNYPRGLAALLEDRAERYAVIDVGTNSVKFHVGERLEGDAWRPVVDRAEVTRLGEGLDVSGEIAQQALERTSAAIAGMVDEARRSGVLAIAAVGTAGLRIARNSAAAIEAIRARTGIRVEPISGEDEARLAYLATKAGLGLAEGSLVVFDTGGGSTQFTFGHGGVVDERFSVDVGAARFTERFGLAGPTSSETLDEARTAISADLARIDGRPAPDALVAMGGAVTNMTAVMHGLATYDPAVVQGTVLDRVEIDRQIELYRSQGADRRRTIVGLQPARAEVILAGALIVRMVMEKLGQASLTVSDRGLRHGLLVDRFGR